MSLISDALKKAQRVRTGEGPAGTTAVFVGRRSQPMGMSTAWIAALVVGLVAVAIAVTVFLMRSSPADVAAQVALATAKARPAPAAANTSGGSLPTVLVVPAAIPPTKAPDTAAPTGRPATSSPAPSAQPANIPPPATPTAAVPAVAPAPQSDGKPDPRIVAYVDSIGNIFIRSGDAAAGTAPRIMMNEKIYRINDYVERSLGLRLKSVEADHITFTDERGVTYTKNY